MSALIIIPARYESSRFPGKPLTKIAGKSLIQRVYEQCVQTEADVIVATDDQRIFDHILSFDGNVCMTSKHHENGTERLIEAFERILDDGEEYDVIINVQGDEPLIDPEDITRLINMMEEEETDIGTLVRVMDSVDDVLNPNVVKVVTTVFDEGLGDALYFSRLPIPYNRENPKDIDPENYYQHIGIYAFQSEALVSLKNSTPSPLEEAEKLEQLRWLQNHFVVSVIETEHKSIGVDTPEDVAIVENILKRS
ncbi:MAG: 3-deoxy-manno-octulosonate cytidylyltransferase [Flavobacteriales bacterium]|nr:3-deoxy-manno-octulosonate cytidylyltransferase [Bacteroidota bacterium]MCB9239576.1 3-deoxy-manno-octulosonate cytidylyltransferase [Flavobacteriales bacterium]